MRLRLPCVKVSRIWFLALVGAGVRARSRRGRDRGPGGPPQAQPAGPLPFVSPIFGDNMVLQRGKPNPIWGWSQPGDTVRVEIGEHSATATAGADGKWTAKIDPPARGRPLHGQDHRQADGRVA